MRTRAAAALIAAGLIGTLQTSADACGGTFCDTGPQAMPVDQSGENILFVVKDTTVEAHVQILYEGEAERFAWVVPLPAEPTVTVGSQPLFDALLSSTVPTIGFTTQRDQCPSNFAPMIATGGTGGAAGGGGGGGVGGGVEVLFQKIVGTFEVTALTGSSAVEVTDWLANNGYESIDTAPAILQRYVDRGMVFVALKLTAGAESDSIHPLVFEYVGEEPCIPLELTAVAAVEDMGVRAFFLGDDRVVPTTYSHVKLNPVRIDWQSFGDNYNAVVSRAVDEAGGRAFITEYAGSSGIVTSTFENPEWNAAAFQGLDRFETLNELRQQGLGVCSSSGDEWICRWDHPLILSLLREHLPAPPGVDENAFYACLGCSTLECVQDCSGIVDYDATDGGSATLFDSIAFSNSFDERIIQPARHADWLLNRWPYLTRLFSTISPSEMTADPFFTTRPDLPEVSLPTSATRRISGSDTGMILPDGREVALDGVWPAFTSNMPWAERIEQFGTGMETTVVRDSVEQIDTQLAEHNAARGWPPPPLDCSGPVDGGVGGSGATMDGGGNRSQTDSGPDGAISFEDDPSSESCSCRLAASSNATWAGGAWALVGLGLAWARRRRPASVRGA